MSSLMFFCAPQGAYMLTEGCESLRRRPAGKAPGGGPVRPTVCEKCPLANEVDARTVPTVTLAAFMEGTMPARSGGA